ncbi:MAG: hypothetical protein WCW33_00825 [Candidatus Babeliales bacterium]|jgi:hypothetical protein
MKKLTRSFLFVLLLLGGISIPYNTTQAMLSPADGLEAPKSFGHLYAWASSWMSGNAAQADIDEGPAAKRPRIEAPESKEQEIVTPRLLPLFGTISIDELKAKYLGDVDEQRCIFACDFRIKDIEKAQKIDGGYMSGNIINIDHHAPIQSMMSFVTATSLAIDYILAYGDIPHDALVLINHTDCDSILSSLIICGILLPDGIFAQAAESADHTGQENDIADLLQAIAPKRDLNYSRRNLLKLLAHEALDKDAEILLQERRAERIFAHNLIATGKLEQHNHVTFLQLSGDQNVDIQLLIGLLPKAEIIMTARPMPDNPSLIGIKIMCGAVAPIGLYLNKIGLPDGFDGRWDAVSNKRAGATRRSPLDYIDMINTYIDKEFRPAKN